MATCRLCPSPAYGGGLCHRHYQQVRRGALDEPLVNRKARSDAEREAKYVTKTDSCWLWTGSTGSTGYGQVRIGSKLVKAHIWMYERYVGPVPEGLELDHMVDVCSSTMCVRPDHLEPVTHQENMLRSRMSYRRRTLCRNGLHDITDPANVHVHRTGKRQCLPCYRAAKARSDQRRSAS